MEKFLRITIECIQMVVGYLDIFVFEELGFAVRPVVDGIDGVVSFPFCLIQICPNNWEGYKRDECFAR